MFGIIRRLASSLVAGDDEKRRRRKDEEEEEKERKHSLKDTQSLRCNELMLKYGTVGSAPQPMY